MDSISSSSSSDNSNNKKSKNKKSNDKSKSKSKEKSKRSNSKKHTEIEEKGGKKILGYIEELNYYIEVKITEKYTLCIKLKSKENNDSFFGEFSLKDLIEENKIFSLFESINDVENSIKDAIKKGDFSIYLDVQYDFYFEYSVELNGRIKKLRLLLEAENPDSKKRMSEKIKKQTKEIDKLTKKNEKLQKLYDVLHDSVQHNLIIQHTDLNNIFYEPKNPFNLPVNSKIFKTDEEILFIKKNIAQKLFTKNQKQNFKLKLIYRGSRDGGTAKSFHKKCDGICPIILLVKTMNDVRFGGFTETYFESCNEYKGKKDDKAFIFSLDKLKKYDVQEGQNAILCYKDYGPIFYGNKYSNIFLSDNFFKTQGNVAEKGDRFNTEEDFEINGGVQKFDSKQIEVFQIILCEKGEENEMEKNEKNNEKKEKKSKEKKDKKSKEKKDKKSKEKKDKKSKEKKDKKKKK